MLLKAMFLARGYGTRLYQLIKNRAKPLLEVGGKTIMEHLLEKIRNIEALMKYLNIYTESNILHMIPSDILSGF